MIEAGRAWLIVDLSPLAELDAPLLRTYVDALRPILLRARECKLELRLVVPLHQQLHLIALREELRTSLYWPLGDALASLRRLRGPRPGR